MFAFGFHLSLTSSPVKWISRHIFLHITSLTLKTVPKVTVTHFFGIYPVSSVCHALGWTLVGNTKWNQVLQKLVVRGVGSGLGSQIQVLDSY
jgi:hypothetical protein